MSKNLWFINGTGNKSSFILTNLQNGKKTKQKTTKQTVQVRQICVHLFYSGKKKFPKEEANSLNLVKSVRSLKSSETVTEKEALW